GPARTAGEEAARERRLGERGSRQSRAGGGDVEGRKVRSTEGDAGRPRHGHVDDLIERTVGPVAVHAPTVPDGAPDAAVAVDAKPVRPALLHGDRSEDAAVGEAARGRVTVIGVDMAGDR